MTQPFNVFAFDADRMQEAAERWYGHEQKLETNEVAIDAGRFAEVDTKERLAKRVNRLVSQVRGAAADASTTMPAALRALVDHGPYTAQDINNEFVERVIGETRDFLSISFFVRGVAASRCVARLVTHLTDGRTAYGTGFLVSPNLLITNNHVLSAPADASATIAEFNYQSDDKGNPMPVARFTLRPDLFFLTDPKLDFTLVAISPASDTGVPLAGFGFIPIIGAEGKIVVGEPVNIIQHPRGEMKQIVIRDNLLIAFPDEAPVFAHYRADTEPGSSGSPVFSDQWELVALHHQSVPAIDPKTKCFLDIDGKPWRRGIDDPARLAWAGNEGIRSSALVAFITQAPLKPHEIPLRKEFLDAGKSADAGESTTSPLRSPPTPGRPTPTIPSPSRVTPSAPPSPQEIPMPVNPVGLPLPLTITVTISSDASGPQAVARIVPPPSGPAPAVESFVPADYADREGFNRRFLSFPTPLPTLTNTIRAQAVEFNDPATNSRATELKYHHYSVIMNGPRRVAFVSAVNIDADAPCTVRREGPDKWIFDPRVPKQVQTDESLYASNPYDRGHLTRRADAAWGQTDLEAQAANADTFHFTNCSPQHEIFNQSQKATKQGLLLWGNIENHVASQAKGVSGKKLCVYNGPVFRSSDELYRGIKIPKQFWKLIAYERDNGQPGVAAFVLSQADLIVDITESLKEDFQPGEFLPFQVKVRDLEAMTKLDFGDFRGFDALEDHGNERFFESDTELVAIRALEHIIL